MRRPRYFRQIKGPLTLAILLHLIVIFSLVLGYPILNNKKREQIPYSVKLFSPQKDSNLMSKTQKSSVKNKSTQKEIKKSNKKIKQKKITKSIKKQIKIHKKSSTTQKTKKNKKIISLKPKKKKKTTKKKTSKKIINNKHKQKKKYSEDEKLKKKLKEIEKKLREKQEEEYLKKRLAALQKAKTNHDTTNFSDNSQNSSSSAGRTNSLLKHYAGLIWMKVRRNWHFPEYLLNNKQLEAIIVITINKDGKILSKRFEKKSGFPAFDRSVLKAIHDSNPLPPLPKALGLGPIEIGIRFNPNRMNF